MNKLYSTRASELDGSKEPPWLIPGLLPEGGISFCAGHSKTNKSFFAVEIACSLASGLQAFRNWLPVGRRRVLYIAGEDSRSNIAHRIRGLSHAKAATVEELDLHVIAEEPLHLDTEDGLAALEAEIERIQPTLVILDPLARFLPHTPESSARKMGQALEALAQLAQRRKITFLIVHHWSKAGKPGDAGRAMRGSSQLDSYYTGAIFLYHQGGELLADLRFRHAEAVDRLPLRFFCSMGSQFCFLAGNAAIGKGWVDSDAKLAATETSH